jgi:3-hydroxyacyl-CoA dehydrogenase
MADRGRIQAAEARHLSSLLHGTLDYRDFAPCDFVIEAVFEELAVKQQVFAEVEGVIRTDCVLASNTSSLSVSAMAANLTHGERSVGFHFFNPVAVLPLIELIQGRQTDRKTLATAFDVAKRLRKTAILVQDAPAFVVNRLLTRMLVECFAAVAEGASFQDVDTALLALGLPIAPFDLLELVGPAVAHHVLENLNRAYGPERFAISEPFTRMVRANKRSIYLPGSPPRQVDPEVERLWAARPPVSIHPETIRERVLHALATEIDTILKEGVVQSSRDVDLAMILGAGWPFFMGGITMYLDMAGVTPKLLQKVFFEF